MMRLAEIDAGRNGDGGEKERRKRHIRRLEENLLRQRLGLFETTAEKKKIANGIG